LSVVARSGREFAVAHGPQLATERLLGDGDAEFLEYPLHQIDQTPAHHAVHCRDRTAFDHAGKDLALAIVELGRLSRRLAIHETGRPSRIEAQDPVSDDLKANPADFRGIRARCTVIDCRKSQKTAGLRAVLGLSRQTAQQRCIEIQP
jgi:hypothetical protein